MTDIQLLSLAEAQRSRDWAGLCGSADLFAHPTWLAVERTGSGPWVPAESACLALSENGRTTMGMTLQQFDTSVDDVIVRPDRMMRSHPAWRDLAEDELADTLLPSLVCGGWFNSRILARPGTPPGEARTARRALIAESVALGRDRGSATVVYPYLDAARTELRADLRDAGFVEIPAPNRHVFHSDYPSYDEYFGNVLKRKTRNQIRRELKRFDEAGVKTAHELMDDSNVEKLARLAHNLEVKYGQKSTYEHMAGWFSAIARHTRTSVFTAELDGRLFAMSMWVHHEGRMYGFHCGFDYEVGEGLHTYSVVVYRLPIAFACSDSGTRYLEYGVGGDHAKLTRGTEAVPQVLSVKPLTAGAEAVVARLRDVPEGLAGPVGTWV
ncbi:GNAT family N-acetyltransferase [Streptomyces sp. NPDC013181]|uniref:GNAT family N-acetyltransferase n=1 Tax=Streptomyces sp. NPDC013181 TaxID=3364864 RepID=UPI00367E21D3